MKRTYYKIKQSIDNGLTWQELLKEYDDFELAEKALSVIYCQFGNEKFKLVRYEETIEEFDV